MDQLSSQQTASTSVSTNNYPMQNLDTTKQSLNYGSYMIPNGTTATSSQQDPYLYTNQNTTRVLPAVSTPSSTISSLSSSSSSSTTSTTSTPPLTQTPTSATNSTQFSHQQRNSTILSTNSNLTWPNYEAANQNSSTNTTVLPLAQTSTQQYLRPNQAQQQQQYSNIMNQNQQQVSTYNDWTNNHILNSNSTNWQQSKQQILNHFLDRLSYLSYF